MTWRNLVACWTANLVIRIMATKDYRDFLRAVNKLGLEEFDRLFREYHA